MSLKEFARDVRFYGVVDFIQRSVTILLVPFYITVLSPSEYGNLDMILIVGAVLTVLVDLQFISGFSRFYLEYVQKAEGARFVGSIVLTRLAGGLVVTLGFILLGQFGWVEVPGLPPYRQFQSEWLFAIAIVPLSLVFDVLLLQARMLGRKMLFALGAITLTVATTSISVVLVVVFGWGVKGVLCGLLIGKSLGLICLVGGLWRNIEMRLDPAILRRVSLYALPLVPGWWVAYASSYAGRFFIYALDGAAANAVLALCMKITAALGMFAVAFRMAWEPLAMRKIGEPDRNEFYVSALRVFLAVGCGSLLALAALIAPAIQAFAPIEYEPVSYYFPLFAVAALVGELAALLHLGNQIAKKTAWISVSSFVKVVVNFIILIWLARSIGIAAVGIGLLLGSGSQVLVTYASGQRNCRIPYDVRAFMWAGVTCVLLICLRWVVVIYQDISWIYTPVVVTMTVLMPLLILSKQERQWVHRRLVFSNYLKTR